MDFNTHKKFAKLDDGTEDPSTRSVVVSAPEVREMDEADKLAKIISDTLLSKWVFDFLARVGIDCSQTRLLTR